MKDELDPMQLHHSFYRFVRSYHGSGHIRLQNGKEIDCIFECGQTHEGNIIVCSRQYERFLPPIINKEIGAGTISRLSGHTFNGQRITANITLLLHLEGSSQPFVSFYARDLDVRNVTAVSIQALKYNLINLELFSPLNWRFRKYNVAIKKIAGYDEAEREMEATKRANITAELEIKPDSGRIDVSKATTLADDLCSLLSLAKGCIINWLSWDAYEDGDLPVRSYHMNAITSQYNNFKLISENPPSDIDDYVRQVFKRYQDIKKEKVWEFAGAIRHYANTLSSGSFTELKALNLVSLVEYLVGRFSEQENTNKVFLDASFNEEKKSAIRKDLARSLLGRFVEEDLVQNEHISAIRKHSKKGTIKLVLNEVASVTVEGINSRGFPWSLNRLLDRLGIVPNEKEVDIFIKMRNKLVHEARFLNQADFAEINVPYENQTVQFFRVISLTSRIMLAILGYRGYYKDWNLWRVSEGVEWAGSTMTSRVTMQYRKD